jgi:hypothetical protein
MERRKFLDQFIRWAMAGGLFSLSGFLVYRRQYADADDCNYLPACAHCSLFDGCHKPVKNRRLENGKENQK